MRIGLIGPAEGDHEAFREAAEFLLGDAGVDRAIYLGKDGMVDALASAWAREIGGAEGLTFEERAARLALHGDPEEITALLRADTQQQRLTGLCSVPPPPGRAVEMAGDRIVLLVYDKSVLDEEDIANASIIVFGAANELLLKRFGHRYFFTPGPLAGQKVGILEVDDDGKITVAAFAPSGAPLFREVLAQRGGKVTVS